MAAFGGAYLTGSPWIGVLCGALAGAALATLHGLLCSLDGVNDVATGIALMILGTGLAFYFGKPLIQPQAPQIPFIALGNCIALACSGPRISGRTEIPQLGLAFISESSLVQSSPSSRP